LIAANLVLNNLLVASLVAAVVELIVGVIVTLLLSRRVARMAESGGPMPDPGYVPQMRRWMDGLQASIESPLLGPNEVAVWSGPANRTQGWRAVGGKLFVTDQRVVFIPHSFDRKTGGSGWSCSGPEIQAIGV